MKINELEPIYCEFIPDELQEGKIYIAREYGTAIHLCCCGCKNRASTRLMPFWNNGWTLTENAGKVTLRPSIGNFNGESPYHAHYYITENRIEWL